jgi:hypothetical protein
MHDLNEVFTGSLVDLIPKWDASNWTDTWKRSDQRFRWSGAGLWAWLDLNQRPHPYQQSPAERHADCSFPW